MSEWTAIKTVVTGIEAFLHLWTPKIQCDECGTQYIAHGLHGWDSLRDPEKVDRVIRENGWIVDGKRHVCPPCALLVHRLNCAPERIVLPGQTLHFSGKPVEKVDVESRWLDNDGNWHSEMVRRPKRGLGG